MKVVFVDLRSSDEVSYFAFYDTVKDKFETHSDNQIFESWEIFKEHYTGKEIERYKRLCPSWAFDK